MTWQLTPVAAEADDEAVDARAAIECNLSGPRRVRGDEGEVDQHPLPDQIEADKYLKGQQAADVQTVGLRFRKLSPPGTV